MTKARSLEDLPDDKTALATGEATPRERAPAPRQRRARAEAKGAESEASLEGPAQADGGAGRWLAREIGEWWALLRYGYFTFDRRTLGLGRIALGYFLVMDLFRRATAWKDMYSDEGVLPTHLNLLRPQAWGAFSIFNAFSTPGELRVLWVVMFVTFMCLLLGYKTKVAQLLTVILIPSMNGRVLFIENGGYTVHNLLVLWTCFLPLGDRFSLDALLASLKRRREASAEELNDRSDVLTDEQQAPFVSLLGLVLLIQLSAIYFFNVLHKTGPAWKNGTAVHYVLYVDRMVNPIIGLVRDHIPNFFILFLTKTTLLFEASIPFALLQPFARVWSRRLGIMMINFLHLGFGTAMVLGPFAWACCTFSTLLFSAEDWNLAWQTMRREHRARVVLFDPRSGGALFVCRLLKRLDHFELLTFEEASGLPLGIAVRGEGERVIHRTQAVADMVAALPLGPIVASVLRAPLFAGLFDAAFASLEKRELSRFFGLRFGPSVTLAGPSLVRRRAGTVVAGFRELAILAFFVAALSQAAIQLWVLNKRYKFQQPEVLRTLADGKLRFQQGWYMFSPNPVMDDGTIIVDAVTVDGRHIDPFTYKEPDFDLGSVKSYGYNQIWSDYFNRMHLAGNAAYRDAMRDYMLRLPERTGNPNDALVSGDVYWVQDMNPKWNDTKSYKYERIKLFSFDDPAAKVAH